MKHFASYGSLKKGYWNHDRFGLGEPIATSTIEGTMYVNPSLGYPHLFEEEEGLDMMPSIRYEVEIYKVEDEVYESINRMEIGSGYYPKEIEFKIIGKEETIKATVWFADPAYVMPKPIHYVEEFTKI